MIILDTYAGLANRMRSIHSAVSMARTFNKRLKVFWPIDNSLNCSYNDLFLSNKNFKIVSNNLAACFMRKYKSKYYLLRKISSLYFSLFNYDYLLFDNEFKDKVWKPPLYLLTKESIPKNFKNAYINTCNEFFVSTVEPSDIFIPNDYVAQLINKTLSNMNSETIGLHIRQTDHVDALRETPKEKFIKVIFDEIAVSPEATFFIATDSKTVKKRIIEIFGADKIIIFDGELNRISKNGMISALVDLYCLSNCRKIYGSYASSYSILASRLKRAKLIIPQ